MLIFVGVWLSPTVPDAICPSPLFDLEARLRDPETWPVGEARKRGQRPVAMHSVGLRQTHPARQVAVP